MGAKLVLSKQGKRTFKNRDLRIIFEHKGEEVIERLSNCVIRIFIKYC
jgi:hypothetical protein